MREILLPIVFLVPLLLTLCDGEVGHPYDRDDVEPFLFSLKADPPSFSSPFC
jgi:hypothetical protein